MRNWKRCKKGDGRGRLKPVAWALPTNQTQNFRRPLLAVIIVGKAHATMYTDEAKGRLKTGGAILPKPPPSFPRRRESRCRSDTCIRQKHLTRLSFPKNRYWKCRIRESDLRQKTVAGEEKPVAWALPTNQTQNFRRPLLANIIVGKAHATMNTDGANSRLKTGEAIFVETSAVIPAQAGIQM